MRVQMKLNLPKSLTVWIFQTGEPLPCDGSDVRPMRAINLCNELVARGHRVVLWSAKFDHAGKVQRECSNIIKLQDGSLQIRLLNSPGYIKNISLSRLWDHAVLAINLWRSLRMDKIEIPDVVFIGYPPIEAAYVMSSWLRKRNIPYMVDVKDQWPEIFLEPLPKSLRKIFRLILCPYFYMGKTTMNGAIGLTAMAQSFLHWASIFSKKSNASYDLVVPLTAPRFEFDSMRLNEMRGWWSLDPPLENKNIIFFVGNLSTKIYEFNDVVEAAKYFSKNDLWNCEFVICGDGNYFPELKRLTKNLSNIRLVGRVNRLQIKALSIEAIAMIAPYRSSQDFEMSIPNKIVDALSLGVPIISSLRGEVKNLIRENKVGSFYNEGNIDELVSGIKDLINNLAARKSMGLNAKKLYEAEFAFEKVYGGLVSHIESIARNRVSTGPSG